MAREDYSWVKYVIAIILCIGIVVAMFYIYFTYIYSRISEEQAKRTGFINPQSTSVDQNFKSSSQSMINTYETKTNSTSSEIRTKIKTQEPTKNHTSSVKNNQSSSESKASTESQEKDTLKRGPYDDFASAYSI